MSKISEDLAYAAGLIDGEGSICLVPKSRTYFLRVQIANTNIDVLRWVQQKFGGNVHTIWNGQSKQNWKTGWMWQMGWTRAAEFIRLIRPWLKIKADQADVALEWQKIRPGVGGGSDVARAGVAELKRKMTILNQKGPSTQERPSVMRSRLRGADHKNSKLKKSDVVEILKIGRSKTQRELARKFKVSQGTISHILLGTTWGSVKGKRLAPAIQRRKSHAP